MADEVLRETGMYDVGGERMHRIAVVTLTRAGRRNPYVTPRTWGYVRDATEVARVIREFGGTR